MERDMSRLTLPGLMLLAVTVAIPLSPADAQVSSGRNPWCIRDGALGSGSWDCTYRTFEQCRLSAEGAGGSCSANPEYRGPQRPGANRPAPAPNNWGWGPNRW
jgi:hypothetical protein